MALVAPMFVTMLFGQVEMIRLGMIANLMTNAAREGCRLAVTHDQTPVTVKNRVLTALNGSGIAPQDLTITITPNNWTQVKASDPANNVTVVLSVPFGKVSWVPTPGSLRQATISASATFSSERVQ
jgi:Flp pilus assembly protein TadG